MDSYRCPAQDERAKLVLVNEIPRTQVPQGRRLLSPAVISLTARKCHVPEDIIWVSNVSVLVVGWSRRA